MAGLKSVLTRIGLFEQAPLHSCSCSVQTYLGRKCVLWDISHRCVYAVDEEGAVSPAMMAPLLGPFRSQWWGKC